MKLPCPHCGDEFTYDAILSGTTFECRYCHGSVQMPPVDSLPPELHEQYSAELDRQWRKEEQKREKGEAAQRRKEKARRSAEQRQEKAREEEEVRRKESERQRQLRLWTQAEAAKRWEPLQHAAQVDAPPPYVYKMLQVPPTIVVRDPSQTGSAAASYLQSLVNEMATEGWEFYRVDPIGVEVPPGCLGSLLGQQAIQYTFYVVSFRKPV